MSGKPYYITHTPCVFGKTMIQGAKYVNRELHQFLPDIKEAVIDTYGNIQVKSLCDETLSEDDADAVKSFLSWTREAGAPISCNTFTTWPKVCANFDKKTGMCADKDGSLSTYCECINEMVVSNRQSQRT